MNRIHENPFRVIGLLANASDKEIQRQKGKITRYVSVGRQISYDYDFTLFYSLDRSADSIQKAFKSIEKNENKVNCALFWFLKVNPFDETAIDYLIKGDTQKAIEIWEKVTKSKMVTAKNFSCFNNLGTLKLLGRTKSEVKEGIEAKIELIESNSFSDFVHTVADQTYTIDKQKEAQIFVDYLLKEVTPRFSIYEIIDLFSNCSDTTKTYLKSRLTEDPVHHIEVQIENTKNKRKANKTEAYELGLKLFVNCENELKTLKSILGSSDLKYKMIADSLAKEVMQCGIDYFQEWKESKDLSQKGLKLLKHAKSIAVGTQTKERIKSNIEGMAEFKSRDVLIVIYILDQIKEVYNSVGYNVMTGQRTEVNEEKVIQIIKDKIKPEAFITIAKLNDLNFINRFYDVMSYVFTKIGKNSYTYSLANSFSKGLPFENILKSKSEHLALTIKPTVGSETAKVASKVDDATGGCVGALAQYLLVIGVFILIVWILGLIFG